MPDTQPIPAQQGGRYWKLPDGSTKRSESRPTELDAPADAEADTTPATTDKPPRGRRKASNS